MSLHANIALASTCGPGTLSSAPTGRSNARRNLTRMLDRTRVPVLFSVRANPACANLIAPTYARTRLLGRRADLTEWPHHGPLGRTCELVQLDVRKNSAARTYSQAVGLLCDRTYALDLTVPTHLTVLSPARSRPYARIRSLRRTSALSERKHDPTERTLIARTCTDSSCCTRSAEHSHPNT